MLLIALVGVWIHGHRTKWDNTWDCICAGVLAFLIIWICIITVINTFAYKEFEQKYMIQKEQYIKISESTDVFENNIISVVDVLNINSELAEMQAHKTLYGNWSIVPEKVFEFTPIGLDESE